MTFNSFLHLKQIIRLGDWFVIVLLVIASFSPLMIFHYTYAQSSTDQLVAYVSIDGDVVDEFILSEDTPHQLITYYPRDGQYNIIEVDGTRIRVKEDNSPDQVAVKTGWITRPGQTSICLPHRLMIEIRGKSSEEAPTDIDAY